MRDWVWGSERRWVSKSIVSNGECGVSRGLVFGMPVICEDGCQHVVSGIDINASARAPIDASIVELMDEMKAARVILGLE
jgi:malate dehydrogenase